MQSKHHLILTDCPSNSIIIFSTCKFKQSDVFIGFQKDTPASVILQATVLLQSACCAIKEGVDVKRGKWANILKYSKFKLEKASIKPEEDPDLWENAVSVHTSLLWLHSFSHTKVCNRAVNIFIVHYNCFITC